jgi:hypothetical protein
MKKTIALLLLLAFTLPGCEKDDICDPSTATTPRLIIDFYSKSNPTELKNVTNLALVAEGHEDEPIGFNGVSRITVPLQSTADITQYKFILNYGAENTAITNVDNLEFKYTRTDIFVSRACGFKTLFIFGANPYTLTDAEPADGTWIQSVTLLQPLILNEDDAHLKITF